MKAPALVRYHGAKNNLVPFLLARFPMHRLYCEPFGGSAAVLLNKPRVMTEVYNDLDTEVYNLFRIVREQPDELARLLSFTPYSKSELLAAFEPGEITDIERARRFIIRSQMAYSSTSINEKSHTFKSYVNTKDYCSCPRTWTKLPDTVYRGCRAPARRDARKHERPGSDG